MSRVRAPSVTPSTNPPVGFQPGDFSTSSCGVVSLEYCELCLGAFWVVPLVLRVTYGGHPSAPPCPCCPLLHRGMQHLLPDSYTSAGKPLEFGSKFHITWSAGRETPTAVAKEPLAYGPAPSRAPQDYPPPRERRTIRPYAPQKSSGRPDQTRESAHRCHGR